MSQKIIVKTEWIIVSVCLFLAVFFIGHADSKAIVTWGLELIRHIKSLDIGNYISDLNSLGTPTNYGVIINSIVGLTLLPAFLFEVMGFSVSLNVYILLWKIVNLLVLVFIIYMFRRIAEDSKNNKWDSRYNCYLFSSSIVVVIYGVAMGQVDLISIMFVVLGLRMFQKKRYIYMSLLMSVAIAIKTFPVFIVVPLFIYLFGELFLDKKKLYYIGMCVSLILPLAIERVVANLISRNYFEYKEAVDNANFIPKVFSCSILGIPIIIVLMILTLLIFFVLVIRKKACTRDVIIFSCILYLLLYIFVEWSPQYLVYGLLCFCFLLSGSVSYRISVLLAFLIQLGLIIVCMVDFNVDYINGLIADNTIASTFLYYSEVYISTLLSEKVRLTLGAAGRVVIYLGMAGTIALDIFSRNKKGTSNDRQILEVIIVMPLVVYTVMGLMPYLIR